MRYFLSLALVLLSIPGLAAPPAGYYNSCEGLSGDALRAALTTRTATSFDQNYDSARDDMYATVDDVLGNNIIECHYTGATATIECRFGCTNNADIVGFTAEHTYPQSQYNSLRPMVSDLHQLFPVTGDENTCRSDNPFNEPTSAIDECTAIGDGGYKGRIGTTTVYRVRDQRKGDTARAMMYMIVRYWDRDPDFDAGIGPQDLTPAQIGLYLEWHLADPPDDRERDRNDRIFAIQANRNPFVDRPEFADFLWGDVVPTPTPTPTITPTPTPVPDCTLPLWINELHYDNNGADTGEGVEVAGPAGTTLQGWQVVPYNGAGGTALPALPVLTGTIPDQANGYGTAWFPVAAGGALQNGSPDAVALVDPAGVVVQFLAYEGNMIAVGGPADGQQALDIGVAEADTTPVGSSLQLVGTATCYDGFTWAAPAAASPGEPNAGQVFPAAAAYELYLVY